MSKRGLLIIYTGPSGCGKGTVMAKFLPKNPETRMSVSCTTRAPRQGEIDGVHYFYITREKFEAMIAENAFLEYAEYAGNYYGTPKKAVTDMLDAGKNVILEIEIQCALKIKEKFPETVLMFITAPSAEELKDRLIGRGTETQEVIDARMSRAYEESLGVENYDYLVINDDLDACVELVHDIIQKERAKDTEVHAENRVSANIEFINNMRKELLSFSKGV